MCISLAFRLSCRSNPSRSSGRWDSCFFVVMKKNTSILPSFLRRSCRPYSKILWMPTVIVFCTNRRYMLIDLNQSLPSSLEASQKKDLMSPAQKTKNTPSPKQPFAFTDPFPPWYNYPGSYYSNATTQYDIITLFNSIQYNYSVVGTYRNLPVKVIQ